jgi:hypothetical protein
MNTMTQKLRVALISIVDDKAVIIRQLDCQEPNKLKQKIDELFKKFKGTEYEYDIWEQNEEVDGKLIFDHLEKNQKQYARIDTWGFSILADLYIYDSKHEKEMLENFNLAIADMKQTDSN